jgi:serine/threonine-protein kinase
MSNDPLINTQFGQYFIEQQIQIGGMATVYRATHQQRNFLVALKILKSNYQREADVVERFKREAEVTKTLEHPHIVRCVDSGDFNGMAFLAMPYIEGGSIADMLKKGGAQIPLWRSAEWIMQIASALDYAHLHGIIHRDLKPGNILLDKNQKAFLTDFGIARVLEAVRLTMPGTQMPGTVRYMSPEQARGEPNINHLSDIYAFGVVAYILSTGYYPFDGRNEPAILDQHLTVQLPQPTRANPKLPQMLDGVLFKCLAKRAQDRYQSASEFANAFRQAVMGYEQTLVIVDPKQRNPAAIDNRPPTETKPPTALRRPENFPANMPIPDQRPQTQPRKPDGFDQRVQSQARRPDNFPPNMPVQPPQAGYPYIPPQPKKDNSNLVIYGIMGVIALLALILIVLVVLR